MKPIILALFGFFVAVTPASADEETYLIQEKLNECGVSVPVTGNFGEMTDAAIRRFQEQRGLDPDGIVGPATRDALFACRQVHDDDYKAPLAEETEDVPAQCKPAAIEEIGRAWPDKEWALASAMTNWARKARFQHGEIYADPDNARPIKTGEPCTKSTVGGFITNYRCIFRAFPCRTGN
jgi:hypothetical protein